MTVSFGAQFKFQHYIHAALTRSGREGVTNMRREEILRQLEATRAKNRRIGVANSKKLSKGKKLGAVKPLSKIKGPGANAIPRVPNLRRP
jgi:3'-phosphoadenosine 5'-phosphosulfate sulfotransferase